MHDKSLSLTIPRVLFQTPRFDVVEVDVPCAPSEHLPGRVVTKQLVRHRGSVAILPCLDKDRVCLIENFRPAAARRLWEIPAGTLEQGEPLELCAARELKEETGYTALRWQKLFSFYASPGIMTEKMHLFLAWNLQPGPQALEPGEDIVLREMKLMEALAMIDRGEIEDAKTIMALQWLAMHAPTLKM